MNFFTVAEKFEERFGSYGGGSGELTDDLGTCVSDLIFSSESDECSDTSMSTPSANDDDSEESDEETTLTDLREKSIVAQDTFTTVRDVLFPFLRPREIAKLISTSKQLSAIKNEKIVLARSVGNHMYRRMQDLNGTIRHLKNQLKSTRNILKSKDKNIKAKKRRIARICRVARCMRKQATIMRDVGEKAILCLIAKKKAVEKEMEEVKEINSAYIEHLETSHKKELESLHAKYYRGVGHTMFGMPMYK